MNTLKRMTVALSLATAFASPALAASYASASLTGFTYTLYDLDLSYGITPTLTWVTSSGSYVISNAYENSGITSTQAVYDAAPFSSISTGEVTTPLQLSEASASITETSLSTSGSTLGTTVPGTASHYSASSFSPYSSYTWSPYYGPDTFAFSLSGNTTVTFTALSFVEATTTVGYAGNELAYAETYMETAGGAGGTLSVFNIVQVDSATTSSSQRQLTVSFSNLGVGDLSGKFYAEADVVGRSSVVTAVPEPETYAMLLAGLSIVGAITRRRKRMS